ncbi:MAG TPA: S9 family peptidase, partial [Fimbriimonadaceae bacterium]|nr:S9 family peptidase [Fimbriimonadaceae bacterium]
YVSNLYTVDLKGKVQAWTQGESGAGQGRWSPDGSKIAFVSGRDKPKSQIYLIPTTGGEATKLTDLPEGDFGEMRWSPDGKWIAFAFREQHPDWTEEAKKKREEKGLSAPPRVIDDIWYRLDGDGYFLGQRHNLYVVEVATGESKKLHKPGPLGVFSFDWSPDSKELAVAHTDRKRPMAETPNDQIWRIDLKGKATKVKGLPEGEKSVVRWSPDGKSLAYAGDIDLDDPWGVRNVKLYVVPAEGGEPKCLTERDDYCLAASTISDTREAAFDALVNWAPDSKGLFVQIGWHGESQLGYVDAAKGGVKVLTKGAHTLTIGSGNGAMIAGLIGTTVRLSEVCVIDAKSGAVETLTSFNRGFHDKVQLSEPEEVWLDSTDGAKVQAWVMKPIDFKAPKKYPAVLEIHGGPHTQYGLSFFHEFQVLAAAGYVVVFSNPRGSKGYGEKFCAAIRGDWGKKDWDDIQTVTRYMQHLPFVNAGGMGVMGGSYGGFMTNWTIGHSTDFKAAITDRCVSNFLSMAGNSDFPFNKDGYFGGTAWGSLEKIEPLWNQSPIAYFENVKTPTLIIHSEGDLRCNVEQSEQVFTALQQEGVDCRFVRYPQSTFHGMSRSGPPDLRIHRLHEILNWWEKHLKG